jgi:hypothetical protein
LQALRVERRRGSFSSARLPKPKVAGSRPVVRFDAVRRGAAGQREDTAGENQETDMATATQLGQTGLQGWREKVADGISQPVANRAPLEEDQVRAIIGGAFFLLALIYVAKTISAATRQART